MKPIRKLLRGVRRHGASGVCEAAFRLLVPERLDYLRTHKHLFEGRVGLEIGGPSRVFERHGLLPIYPLAARIDNCNFAVETTWQPTITLGRTFRFNSRTELGWQYIAEATQLDVVESETYDFVLSSHVLEHIANPLRALQEWSRVLASGGTLVVVVPHKDGTFDHCRPTTLLEHLIADHVNDVGEDDMTHLDEILRLHDLSRDEAAGQYDAFRERAKQNTHYRCLHHHVFDTRLTVEVFNHLGLQILAVQAFRPDHIVLVCEKRASGEQADNAVFLGARAHWRSPFPSDRPADQRGR